jgi:hypothetical protein
MTGPINPVVVSLPETGVNGVPIVPLKGEPPLTVSKTNGIGERSNWNRRTVSPAVDELVIRNGWVKVSPSMRKASIGAACRGPHTLINPKNRVSKDTTCLIFDSSKYSKQKNGLWRKNRTVKPHLFKKMRKSGPFALWPSEKVEPL